MRQSGAKFDNLRNKAIALRTAVIECNVASGIGEETVVPPFHWRGTVVIEGHPGRG